MSAVSKSVLQPTGQVIHEDDDQEIIRMLNRAKNNIHWELESPSYEHRGVDFKVVLRYKPERKRWATYEIYANSGGPVCTQDYFSYRKKHPDARKDFYTMCTLFDLDSTEAKRIRIVPKRK